MSIDVIKSLFLRWFAGALLAGFLLSLALSPFFRSVSAAPVAQTLVDYSEAEEVDDFVKKYHNAMNEFLNGKMDDLMDTDVPAEEKELREQLPASKNFRDCPENYTSTWCVAMTMTDEYFRLRRNLIEMRKNFASSFKDFQGAAFEKSLERADKIGDLPPGYTDYVSAVEEVDAKIDFELHVAEETLELAASAYNELHIAWALHVKYLELIDQLEDFRNALAGIRDEVEIFPATFFNVQTSQCT